MVRCEVVPGLEGRCDTCRRVCEYSVHRQRRSIHHSPSCLSSGTESSDSGLQNVYFGLQTHLLYTISATHPAVALHNPTSLTTLYQTTSTSHCLSPSSTEVSYTAT